MTTTEKNNKLLCDNLLSLSYGKIIRKDIKSHFGLLPANFSTYQVVENGYIILRLMDLQNDKKSLRVGLVKEKGIITSAYIGIILTNLLNSKFIYYLLYSYDILKVFYWQGGSVRQSMGFNEIKALPLIFPKKETQTKIATYLDTKTQKIDKEIALLEQKIEKYRELKQTLINETVLRGLDRGVEFKDSGIEWIGEIPEGWEVKRGKNIFKFKKIINKNLKSKNVLSLTYSGVINKDYNQLNGLNPTTYETYQFVKKNNLIFKLIDLENIKTSRVGLVHEDGIMSSAYIRLEPSKTIFSKYFYYLYFYYYKINLFNNLGGGVRATLNYTGLLNILILIPPYKEQVKISNYLDEKTQKIDNITQTISKKIELLKEFRKTLINDVVTGRVKV
jgi:type I restriction enzyme S subunit